MAYGVVVSTIDNRDRAEDLARLLLDSRLVAYVNIVGPMTSLYHWQSGIECDEEYLLLMNTEAVAEQALIERIEEHHPYEVPEVIALPILEGSSSYLSWISAAVSQQEMSCEG